MIQQLPHSEPAVSRRRVLTSAAAMLLLASAYAQSPTTPTPVPDMFVVTNSYPDGYVKDKFGNPLYGSASNPLPNPLTWALEHSGAPGGSGPMGTTYGFRIHLASGDHDAVWFDDNGGSGRVVDWIGSTATNPVVIQGAAGATLARGPGDTVAVYARGNPNHPFRYVTWQGVRFEAGSRAGIFMGEVWDVLNGAAYEGWTFEDCEIDGQFDHVTQSGPGSKWGFFTWAASDLIWSGGSIHNIQLEHAFYLHNNLGDVLIEDADLYEVGRTAVQITARKTDSGATGLPANPGDITIRNNVIADTGLQNYGFDNGGNPIASNFHNGQSVTILGRQQGITRVHGNRIEYGLDTFTPGLRVGIMARPDYPSWRPYGNGAFVSWTTASEDYEGSLFISFHENQVAYEANSGAADPIQISAVQATCVRRNLVISGVRNPAIVLGRPGTQTHPAPTFFEVRDNIPVTGTGTPADITLDGVVTAQPFANGPACR